MKKRFISVLLTVLMVMSLFSGMSLSAYADGAANAAQTIEYTMVEGDYVLRICQKLGLNFYTCKPAIMTLNNINEGQWSKLAVGRTLLMPASDQDAIKIINGGTTASTQQTASTQPPASTSSVTTTQVRDTVAYYLVPYTLSSGETVSAVCNNLGVNFSVFHEYIRQINGVSSWNKVQAGQTLLIPTVVMPGVGTSCYAVMQHKVKSNETAYSIVSNSGLNYNGTKGLLEVLNQTSNLADIKVNTSFYYPMATTILYPGTGSSSTSSTTTTTTTTTTGNTTTTTTTTTTSKLYKLTTNISSANGTMTFFVNNAPVNEARAGDVVTIVTQMQANNAIESLTVKHMDGSADMLLAGDSFIMPNCDVRVDAIIRTGHNITIEANYAGKATTTVGGVSVSSAVKGAAVTVVSTDPTYEISNIYAYYKNWLSAKKPLALTGNSFVMPDMDVTVEVTLKPVSTYAFYANTIGSGTFFLQVNGSPVTRAAKGAKVTVVPKAQEGFEPFSVQVFQHGTTTLVSVYNNTFTMPGCDVDVTVTFRGRGNTITLMPAEGGSVTSAPANEANTGATVTLTAAPETGFTLDHFDVVRNSDGLKVSVTVSGNTGTFTMPEGGVTVTPVFVGAPSRVFGRIDIGGIYPATYSGASFYLSFNDPVTGALRKGEFRYDLAPDTDAFGVGFTGIPAGTYVDIRSSSSNGISFVRYEVYDGASVLQEAETNAANYRGYFQMPNFDIVIVAYFETSKIVIGPAEIVGVGTVSFRDAGGNSINAANPDDNVTIVLTPGEGYTFDAAKAASRLLITRKDNGATVPFSALTPIMSGADIIAYSTTFKMPADGVNIKAIFDGRGYTLTMRTFDESGANLTGKGLWQIAINENLGVVDNDPSLTATTVNVAYGDRIVVALTEAGYSNYDLVSFKINGYEYVADVLNYFYNFAMEGTRAQDLEIVAIMRPKVPYEPAIHSLGAYYDASKGNVEFILLNVDPRNPATGAPSSTYSSQFQGTVTVSGGNTFISGPGLQFVKYAMAGDWVAIVAAPNSAASQFNLDVDDISIVGSDATRIVPFRVSDVWMNGTKVNDIFVFRMPETNVDITVSFRNSSRSMTVNTWDNSTGVPVLLTSSGLVMISTDGQNFGDVAASTTFENVGYGTQVSVSRTQFAQSEGWKIESVNVSDGVNNIPFTSTYDGGYFTMPNANITVDVYMVSDVLSFSYPLIGNAQYNGSFVFRDALGGNIITTAIPGDTVFVYGLPNDGYQNPTSISVVDLGTGANIVTNVSAGVWQFVMPNSGVTLSATFEPVPITITMSITTGSGEVTMMRDGVMAVPVRNGDTIVVHAGEVITFYATSTSENITSINISSGLGGFLGTVWTVPGYPTGITTDTMTIKLA